MQIVFYQNKKVRERKYRKGDARAGTRTRSKALEAPHHTYRSLSLFHTGPHLFATHESPRIQLAINKRKDVSDPSDFYKSMSVCVYKKVREPGLEPGSGRWQRPIVPLDHSRCIDGLHNFPTLIDLRNLQKIIVSCFYIRRVEQLKGEL